MKLWILVGVLAGLGQLARAADLEALPVQRFTANYGPGCHIAASLPPSRYGGLGSDPNTGLGGMAVNPIPKSWKSSVHALGLGITCQPADDPVMTGGLTRFDTGKGSWEKDLEARFGSMSVEDRKVLDEATQVLNIRGLNSSGYVAIENDTTGAEDRRQRVLYFCLFRLTKAVCGGGVVGMVDEGRKGDLTAHAIKIIRSIEFLPDKPK